MKQTIYIETTIPSYAMSKPSRDLKKTDRQNSTLVFWENERHKYDLYVSGYVIDECNRGDKAAAEKRLQFLDGINLIPTSDDILSLADTYMKLLDIPSKCMIDSRHLATCVLHQIDILLTWNFTHLGSITEAKLRVYNYQYGLWTPYLLTPDDLLEGRMV